MMTVFMGWMRWQKSVDRMVPKFLRSWPMRAGVTERLRMVHPLLLFLQKDRWIQKIMCVPWIDRIWMRWKPIMQTVPCAANMRDFAWWWSTVPIRISWPSGCHRLPMCGQMNMAVHLRTGVDTHWKCWRQWEKLSVKIWSLRCEFLLWKVFRAAWNLRNLWHLWKKRRSMWISSMCLRVRFFICRPVIVYRLISVNLTNRWMWIMQQK